MTARLVRFHRSTGVVVVAALLAAVAPTLPLCAASDPHAIRTRPAEGPSVAPWPGRDDAAFDAALARLRAVAPGNWQVRRDAASGAVRRLSGGATRPYGADPAAAARGFLDDHGALFGLDERTRGEIAFVRTTRAGGHRVEVALAHAGLEVVDAGIVLLLDPLGAVVHAAAQPARLHPAMIEPLIDESAAIAAARRALPGPGSRVARLGLLAERGGRLVWLVGHDGAAGPRPWTVAVDARDGAIARLRPLPLRADAPATEPTGRAEARRAAARFGTSAPDRRALASGAAPPDPCLRAWSVVGPAGETVLAPAAAPDDPWHVAIDLGAGAFGAAFDAGQAAALYGAGITLHPCFDWTITITWDLHTWDSYSGGEGFWDVFFVNANPLGFAWDLATPDPIADRACDAALEEPGSPIPGPLWSFGGLSFLDEALCSSAGTTSFTITEPFHDELIYLSVGLDTAITGDADAARPSWGTIEIEIVATTKIFDPNPVATLGDPFLEDDADASGAVPCVAYAPIALTTLDPPAPDAPWELIGPWAAIVDLPVPPECAGYAEIPFAPPTSRDGAFPALRGCDAFEAAMAYAHVDASQAHVQGLGYLDVCARPVAIDPHAFDAYAAFYCPDGVGTGTIHFGDGGGDVDAAEDGEIVLHEYAHAIQDAQAPNAWLSPIDPHCFGNETRAWGEGFADAWALLHFFAAKEAAGGDPMLFGQWFGPPTGLRSAGNDKAFPEDMEGLIHDDGEIVSGAILDLFMMLRPGLGDAAARAAVETMLLDGNFLVPPAPTFGDAAEAIIAGDLLATGGAHLDLLQGVFGARGFIEPLAVAAFVNGAAAAGPMLLVPADVAGAGAAPAPLDRVYPWGEDVVLVAPPAHDGAPFSHWEIDGFAREPGTLAALVRMTDARLAEAIYLDDPIDVGAVAIEQMTSAAIAPDTGPTCENGVESAPTGFARSYDLGASAETAGRSFRLRGVAIGVERNEGATIEAEVRVWRDLDGGVPVAAGVDLEFVGSVPMLVPAFAEEALLDATFEPPLELPADATILIEVAFPKPCHARVFPGANGAGQSAPSYMRSFACGIETWTDLADLGYADVALVQRLRGDAVLAADLDGDGVVGFGDLVALLAAWGACPAPCPADLDGDGSVGFGDLVMLLAAWT